MLFFRHNFDNKVYFRHLAEAFHTQMMLILRRFRAGGVKMGCHLFERERPGWLLLLVAIFGSLLLVAASCSPKPPAQEKHFAGRERIRTDYSPNLELRPAYQLIRDRRYAEARAMLEGQLKHMAQGPLRDEALGLVTAAYYGAGQDREGLAFLCTAYQGLSSDDHRFLYQAQAHIRRIRENEGRAAALKAAADARNACNGREDFADIWASIPLVLMEDLHDHLVRTNIYGFAYTDEHDEAELNAYIEAYKRGQNVPFAEYAFYMMRRYDEHVKLFPQSKFRDLSMAARARDNPNKPEFLTEFLKTYPNSPDREDVLYSISKDIVDSQGADAYATFIKDYGLKGDDFDFESYANAVQVDAIDRFDKGNYQAGIEVLKQGKKYLGQCQDQDDCAARINAIGSEIDRAQQLLLGIDDLPPPEVFRRLLVIRKELFWDSVAFNILRRMVDSRPMSDEDRGKALYLLGRMDWDGNSSAYYQELVTKYPDHPLADDALAEIGLNLEATGESDQAIIIYDEVAARYDGRNAVDDALWHKAHILSNEGDDQGAMNLYTQIASMTGQQRLELAAQRILYGQGEVGGTDNYDSELHSDNAGDIIVKQVRTVLTLQDGAGSKPVSNDYTLVGAECGRKAIALDSAATQSLVSGYSEDATSALARANPDAYCNIALTADLKEVSLELNWQDKIFCRIKRSANGPFAADGPCFRRDETLALDPHARAVLRARDFSGLVLAIHSGVNGEGNTRVWSSTVKIQQAPGSSIGYKAGIRANWDILEICGSAVTFDAGTLGRANPDKKCALTFARYPDKQHPDKIDYVTCKARVTLSSVNVVGICRRRHSLLDFFLNLFGA